MTRLASLPVFFAITFLGLSACSPKANNLREGFKPRYFLDAVSGGDHYDDVFEANTIVDRSHSEFQPVISAHSTYWNASMREAYIREMAGRFRLDAEAEKNLATTELQENEAYFVFIISAATREFEWNELERQKSLWRIALESEDSKIQESPERIEVISERDERAQYFYKNMTPFTRTYRVRFNKEKFKDVSNLVLHIAGVRGNLSFEFAK